MKTIGHRVSTFASLGLLLTALTACGGGGGYGGGGSGGTGTYTVGGMVTTLVAPGLVLQNNGGDDLSVSAVGAFTFSTKLAAGTSYSVTVKTTQSAGYLPRQECVVNGGSGNVGGANVYDVRVACHTATERFTVGGTVTGLTGSGLVVSLGANFDTPVPFAVSAAGTFTFPGDLVTGSVYYVAVDKQPVSPTQTCSVGNERGTIETANVTNVSVVCGVARFAYVANAGDDTISVYAVNLATGALTAAGIPVPTGTSPYAIAGSPDRHHLYVVNQMSNNIWAYTVDGTSGALTPILSSPIPTGIDPRALAFDPSGAFLYVANDGSNNLSAYAVNASSGALTPLSTATYVTGTGPSAISVDPSGKFLYVANNGGSNDISVFAVTPGTGALTPVLGSPFAAGGNPHSLAVSAYGGSSKTFIYTANFNGATSSISGFSVNSSMGALTALTGSPFALAARNSIGVYSGYGDSLFVTTGAGVAGYLVGLNGLLSTVPGYSAPAGTNAYSVAIDHSTGVLYVANDGAASISAYRIDDVSATLTEVPNSPFAAGNMPEFIAIL